MKKSREKNIQQLPSVWLSLIPLGALVAMLFFSVTTFGTDTLSGASQLSLLFAGAVAAFLGMAVYKLKWSMIEGAFISGISNIMPSVLILLVIGALSGAWMASGIVPGFIYYGLKIIHPKFEMLLHAQTRNGCSEQAPSRHISKTA